MPPPATRVRLQVAFAGCFGLTLLPEPRALWLGVALLLLSLWLALRQQPGWRPVWLRRMVGLNTFMALVVLALAWQPEGLQQAMLIALRANAVLLWLALLTAGCDEAALARAWLQMGLGRQLGVLMLLMLRANALLRSSWLRVDRASRARAFQARPGLRVWQVRGLQLAWWLDDAMRRAQALHRALQARSFGSVLHQLSEPEPPLQRVSNGLLWAGALVFVAGLWWLALRAR